MIYVSVILFFFSATVLLEQSADQQLVIQNVIRDTIGQVVCMAKNDKGTAQSNLIILDVQCKSIMNCFKDFKSFFDLVLRTLQSFNRLISLNLVLFN